MFYRSSGPLFRAMVYNRVKAFCTDLIQKGVQGSLRQSRITQGSTERFRCGGKASFFLLLRQSGDHGPLFDFLILGSLTFDDFR